MNFSIRKTIRAFVAPDHRLTVRSGMWSVIRRELTRRSEGFHESGAFLLGRDTDGVREIVKALYYDDLDPNAYKSGVCVLTGDSFGKLWQTCREEALTVVADIHTHVGRAFQSDADRTNPMVARAGHLALIASNMGRGSLSADTLCIFEYRGGYRWKDHSGAARQFFYIGFLG